MSYNVVKRIQHTFVISQKLWTCLLTRNVKPDLVQVNIAGLSVNSINCSPNLLVKIIVGPVDPNSITTPTYAQQLAQFRENLKVYGIKAKESFVLHILNLTETGGSPGAARIVTAALTCNNISINSSYIGESLGLAQTLVIEVPENCVDQAQNILSTLNLSTVDETLCVNRNNVDSVCIQPKNSCHCCNTCK